jgi:hypothetical protein
MTLTDTKQKVHRNRNQHLENQLLTRPGNWGGYEIEPIPNRVFRI